VYAIIQSGGKQYRVAAGDRLKVERDVLGSAKEDKVTFSEVLMIGGDQPKVGVPTVEGASVLATIVSEMRGEKIIVFKKKRRHNYRRKNGHRQHQTVLRIDEIHAESAASAGGRARGRRAAQGPAAEQEAQDGA